MRCLCWTRTAVQTIDFCEIYDFLYAILLIAQFVSESCTLSRVVDPETRQWEIEPFESALPTEVLKNLIECVI